MANLIDINNILDSLLFKILVKIPLDQSDHTTFLSVIESLKVIAQPINTEDQILYQSTIIKIRLISETK